MAIWIDNHRVIDPVATQVGAFNAHDLDAFLACFHDDAQVCDIDGTVQMCDKDEMRSRYEQAFRSGVSAEVLDRVRAGAWTVDHERVKRGDGGVREFLVVYEVDDGLISRMIALPS